VAADEQSELPLLDGQAIPLLTPGQRAPVPQAWLENAHRAAGRQRGDSAMSPGVCVFSSLSPWERLGEGFSSWKKTQGPFSLRERGLVAVRLQSTDRSSRVVVCTIIEGGTL